MSSATCYMVLGGGASDDLTAAGGGGGAEQPVPGAPHPLDVDGDGLLTQR